MVDKKRAFGQYFTKGNQWLCPQVETFIKTSGACIAYDPFAGEGYMLRAVQYMFKETVGLDIDDTFGWKHNDSLVNIPSLDNAIIVTNPPYISNYSARRKHINKSLEKYFQQTKYNDVYLLALDKMLDAQDFVVAIIPETFINSAYKQKNRLESITILEKNPFTDTDAPVIVACFNGKRKAYSDIKVYKDEEYICTLQDVEDCRIVPTNSLQMTFNSLNGWLAVRCVDNTNPNDKIRFAFKEDIDYDWNKGIKTSSRLLTLIDVRVPEAQREKLIAQCNLVLANLREKSHDIILSPFKGNTKDGVRRRRLDFLTCRAIVEKSYQDAFFSCTHQKYCI